MMHGAEAPELLQSMGSREVTSPSVKQGLQGNDDELVGTITVTMTQGAGFRAVQATDVMMDENAPRTLNDILHQQQQNSGYRECMEGLAQEVGRATHAIINAMSGLANNIQANYLMLIRELQAWAAIHEENVVNYVNEQTVSIDTVAQLVDKLIAQYHEVVEHQLQLLTQANNADS